MASDPLDLWPDTIQVAPLTPASILKMQADRLREKTRGLLLAEVVTSVEDNRAHEDEDLETVHRFEIIAPKWNRYRHQLFRCVHDATLVHPVTVSAGDPDRRSGAWKKASTQEEFTQIVRELLGSTETAAVIQSLLALSAEAKNGAAEPAA